MFYGNWQVPAFVEPPECSVWRVVPSMCGSGNWWNRPARAFGSLDRLQYSISLPQISYRIRFLSFGPVLQFASGDEFVAWCRMQVRNTHLNSQVAEDHFGRLAPLSSSLCAPARTREGTVWSKHYMCTPVSLPVSTNKLIQSIYFLQCQNLPILAL